MSARADKQVRLSIVCLLLFVALPYMFGLGHGFVYDDYGQIVENPFLSAPGSLQRVLTLDTVSDMDVINGRRPVVLLTYLTDRALWRSWIPGYHLTNLIFHLATCLILFLFLRRLTLDRKSVQAPNAFSFTAAVLFGIHPILIEAVQVPSFRPDILFTLFTLIALHVAATIRASDLRLPLKVVAFCLATWLSLLSKETAVIVPVLLVWMWLCFPDLRPQRWLRIVLPAIAMVLVACFMALCARAGSFQATSGAWNGISLQHPDNLMTAPFLFALYINKLLIPYPLSIDTLMLPVKEMTSAPFLLGVTFLLGASALAFVLRTRRPWVSFGLGILLAGFAPVANIVPLFNPFAERYAYIMAVGFAIIVARTLAGSGFGTKGKTTWRQVLLAIFVTVYLSLSFWRLQDFQDNRQLWTRTLQSNPNSARAHTWIGLEYIARGERDQALFHFQQAEMLNPYEISATINHAILLAELGELVAAEELLRDALIRRPDKAATHWNLAIVLDLQGRSEEASAQRERARKLAPSNPRYGEALSPNS